jgi:hypothetical protein
MLQLLASKNPSNEIAAKILLNGGYDPCPEFSANTTIWTNNLGCGAGFIPDDKNQYCYIILPDKNSLQIGESYCRKSYDSDLVTFDSNSEVDGFLTLVNNGKWLLFILKQMCRRKLRSDFRQKVNYAFRSYDHVAIKVDQK